MAVREVWAGKLTAAVVGDLGGVVAAGDLGLVAVEMGWGGMQNSFYLKSRCWLV